MGPEGLHRRRTSPPDLPSATLEKSSGLAVKVVTKKPTRGSGSHRCHYTLATARLGWSQLPA